MAPPAFSGALMPKKKSELQEISVALRISNQGTKDELFNRIKKHLDLNPDLEDDPAFAGLYVNRRRRSVQPPSNIPSSRLAPSETAKPTSKSTARRVTALDPVHESSPNGDLRDVSTHLKHPISSAESSPTSSPRRETISFVTPSSPPPLPPSPSKSLVQLIPKPPDVGAIASRMREKEGEMMQNSVEMLDHVRRFLSNSRNIWSLTALFELVYLLQAVIPWRAVPVRTGGYILNTIELYYPPLSVFKTYAFWMIVLHWAVPTLVIPAVAGNLISFNSQLHSTPTKAPDSAAPFDPLTAAIIRLAAQVGYPFASFEKEVQGLDVLGFRLRVLNAAVALAFAFAEAIASTPQVFARSLTVERCDRLLENRPSTESISARRNPPPVTTME